MPVIDSILSLKTPEYEEKLEAWKRNEKRFAAGEDVFDDLRKFTWEENNDAAYRARQERAIFPEFPAMVAEKFVGILFQQWPEDMDLGNLQERDNGIRAEMLQADADGVGSDARSLYAFWFEAMSRAVATKFRWILAEAPMGKANTLQEEIDGQRPYFVEYSPTAVPYWHFDQGALQCVRIELEESAPRVVDGEVTTEAQTIHYLMTREGFDGWGDDFKGGGWWMYDEEEELIDSGNWEKTGGEIPLVRLYYERGVRGDKRTGITNIGRIAQTFCDLFSAFTYDAWEQGSGVTFLTGVSYEQWTVAVNAGKEKAKWVPVPGVEGGGQVGIHSVSEGRSSQAIVDSLEWLMRLAMQLIARELTTSPDASGAARKLEFIKGNSPRLASMAGNIEEAMNAAHRFLEMRWGFPDPQFQVSWPREFDLRTVMERVAGLFDLFRMVNAHAPAMFAEQLIQVAQSEGLLTSEDEAELETLKNDIQTSLDLQAQGAQIPPASAFLQRRQQRLNGETV